MGFHAVVKNAFKKNDVSGFARIISSILDPLDQEVFVLRQKDCEVIFANAHAQLHMDSAEGEAATCKSSFAEIFPDLCDYCPYGGKDGVTDPKIYEIDDAEGRTYSVRFGAVEWIDGKPAAIVFLRDLTSEKEVNERLFALAYTDQLTGVPNRQRLKEDFSAMEARIENGEMSGIIALFDLDHFKTVNDTYGHNTGDIVLRRLTEHLQGEQAFTGHLYRLGGDEFVLLYADSTNRFASEGEMKSHYQDLLSTALRAYTLPNISAECTLSIGISFFPKHGINLSEVLRKADIALYKAKSEGRNRLSFFEDQYDSAQKFNDLYIHIQPVLTASGKTFGYELADRGVGDERDEGTVSLSEFNRTLDALGFNDLDNHYHYFISYSKQLLNPAVIRNLPREKFIVQMNLPTKLTKHEMQNNLHIYSELRKNGYKLALDGLNSRSPLTELLSYADYCKFSPTDSSMADQRKIIAANPKTKFIATGVDSHAEFSAAKTMGFNMFQGFFFNQPAIGKKTKEVSPMKQNYLRLLKLSSAEGFLDFREISSVISGDVALTYKLLSILNSAAVGLRNVSSIASAVTYLGEESLKKWIAVLALRGIAEDKPLELVRMSLIRARFGELLSPHFHTHRNPQQVFMAGMLSLLHIALEKSKEEMLEDIPVSDDIRNSLLTKTGVYSDLLGFYENYEYANWEMVSQFIEVNQLEATMVNEAYLESVKWYNDLAGNGG